MKNIILKVKNKTFLAKIKYSLFYFVILIFVWVFFLILPTKIFAQQISLSLSPPLLEIFIKPGKSIMVAYDLKNFGDPVILKANVMPFEAKDNVGNIKIKEDFEGPISFSLDNADVQLNQPFFLKTGERQQLLLRIRVSEGAPEGDYYYTLLAETQPPPISEGVASGRAKATIGANILITITENGTTEVKGKVALFDVLPRFKLRLPGQSLNFFDSNDKIPVVAIVENQGKNLIKSEGEIILKGNFGERAKYQIVPQNILAESQRLITATPSSEIDCPQTEKKPIFCRQPITLLLSGFFIGRYNLSANISFGETSPKIFASTSFIALPFKFLLGLIIALIISIFILKRLSKDK